jgi:hypothetical protein
MKAKDLQKKIAKLETINDQLAAELSYLDQITRALGFAEGLKTLKEAAIEMLESEAGKENPREDETNPPLSF